MQSHKKFLFSFVLSYTLGVSLPLQATTEDKGEESTHVLVLQKSPLENLTPEILLSVFHFLDVPGLCRLAETNTELKRISEDPSLWRNCFLKVIPFAEVQELSSPVVLSPKHRLIATKIIQAALRDGGNIPDFDLLLSAMSSTFGRTAVAYHIFAMLYTLKRDPEKVFKNATRFNLACLNQEERNLAVSCGYQGTKSWPEETRLAYLKKQEEAGDSSAARWIDQALYEGTLGMHTLSPQARKQELDRRAEAGDPTALQLVVSAVTLGQRLGQETCTVEERLADLQHYSQLGRTQAEETVAEAIFKGTWGQDKRAQTERFEDLKVRAQAGNWSAQFYVIQALEHGSLGQHMRPEQERFEELLAMDCAEAYPVVLGALLRGSLGQGEKSIEARIQQIEKVMQRSQEQRTGFKPSLVDMIFEGKGLGQEKRTVEERFQHLERLAFAGTQEAERMLIYVLKVGKLGKESLSDAERFEALEKMAERGSLLAAQEIVKALYEGTLSQKEKAADARYHHLKRYVEDERLKVQELLLNIIKRGGFSNQRASFDALEDLRPDRGPSPPASPLSPELCFALKQEQAESGDLQARKWLYRTLYEGTYGQDRTPPHERFEQLKQHALADDVEAEAWVVRALVAGELGQAKPSLRDTYDALSFWTARGNKEAQHHSVKLILQPLLSLPDPLPEGGPVEESLNQLRCLADQGNSYAAEELANILIYGKFGQFQVSETARFAEVERLSQQGHEKVRTYFIQLLTEGIEGIIHNAEGDVQWGLFWLGQNQRPEGERFEELKEHTLAGDTFARHALLKAIDEGTLGQQREACISNLLSWVALGEKEALDKILWKSHTQHHNVQLQAQVTDIKILYNILLRLAAPSQDVMQLMVF